MAKEKKSLAERYADEVLSDNSAVENCKQCKECLFRDDGTPFSNDYRKSCCQMFKYPGFKPIGVINNTEMCEYRVTKG